MGLDEMHHRVQLARETVRAVKRLRREAGGAEGAESLSETALEEALDKGNSVAEHVAVKHYFHAISRSQTSKMCTDIQ